MSGDSRVRVPRALPVGGAPRAAGNRRGTRASAVLAAAACAATALAGCSRPVAVDPPAADPALTQACATFTAGLPGSLSTAGERRDVTPDSDLTAAYGDPPVSIRCGVPRPDGLVATSTLVTVDGIDWFPEQLTAGWRMTTVGRTADVEITVPEAKGPAPSVAADLAPLITSTLPATVLEDHEGSDTHD